MHVTDLLLVVPVVLLFVLTRTGRGLIRAALMLFYALVLMLLAFACS